MSTLTVVSEANLLDKRLVASIDETSKDSYSDIVNESFQFWDKQNAPTRL